MKKSIVKFYIFKKVQRSKLPLYSSLNRDHSYIQLQSTACVSIDYPISQTQRFCISMSHWMVNLLVVFWIIYLHSYLWFLIQKEFNLSHLFADPSIIPDKMIKFYFEPAELPSFEIKTDQIPNILHQTWKTQSLPPNFLRWRHSWLRNHPHWQHNLWTDLENRQLVKQEYPWLLHFYDNLPKHIQRVDIVRYLYLHKYGGVYADLDFECIKPIDPLLINNKVILGKISHDDEWLHNIPNAFMASVAGHDFWIFVIHLSIARMSLNFITEDVTGPILIRDAYRLYNNYNPGDIELLKPGLVYGFDWRKYSEFACSSRYFFGYFFDEAKCKGYFPNAYSITYWSHSWSWM
eukprot:NODE_870_length_3547_cov_0.466357.p1 type:complete len:348 gc:universal NODE_870_length_3547_cov_0.466357:2477-1434(-)